MILKNLDLSNGSARILLIALAAGLASGCAWYSTSAGGGSGFRSVAVPLLENESLEPEIHQALTDSLIEAFVANGALKVVDEDLADVVLRGTVVEVREEPFTYGDQADQFRITLWVKISSYDSRSKEILWEERRLRGFGIFSATAERSTARAAGLSEAVRMLTEDILDRTQVGGW
jgi:hypothetical protein